MTRFPKIGHPVCARKKSRPAAECEPNIDSVRKVSAAWLRKVALNRQGLSQQKPFGAGKMAVKRAIEHLGYVQIDTISVVERAHHHVLWTRVPNYRSSWLDELIAEGKIFEYWFHAAAYLPICDYRFALPRMEAIRRGEKHWFANVDKRLMRDALARITEQGAMRARDFQAPGSGKGGWWEWKPAKQALEQLFIQGELMVAGRDGFQKRYDLPERVLPDRVDTRFPDLTEQAEWFVDTTLRAHGYAAMKSFTYLRKGAALRHAVAEVLSEKVRSAEVCRIQSDGGDTFYADRALVEDRGPRRSALVKIISPFDNAVIQRQRCSDVFKFDYQIECYVPAAKRRFGYFVLPVIYGDQFVARMDCKAHRKEKQLQILSFHGAFKGNMQADDTFISGLASTLVEFSRFNACLNITLCRVAPRALAPSIADSVRIANRVLS